MEPLSDETLLALLGDADPRCSVAGMRKALERKDLSRFIMLHQDDADPILRRHLHQLKSVMDFHRRNQLFATNLKAKKVTFWETLQLLTILYNPRYNETTLAELLDAFFADNRLLAPTAAGIRDMVKKGQFQIPNYHDIFNLETFFLTEAFSSGCAQPLLWCECFRQIARRHRWNGKILLTEGRFVFQNGPDTILRPDENWKETKLPNSILCHECSETELIHIYLSRLISACIIDNQPYDLCVFTKLLLSETDSSIQDMPYPLGSIKQPPETQQP